MSFEEYQSLAVRVTPSLRNNRDRVLLPVTGLQEESGKIGSLLASVSASGNFRLTPDQAREVREHLADALWYIALLCREAGTSLEEVASQSISQLQGRAGQLDPDRR